MLPHLCHIKSTDTVVQMSAAGCFGYVHGISTFSRTKGWEAACKKLLPACVKFRCRTDAHLPKRQKKRSVLTTDLTQIQWVCAWDYNGTNSPQRQDYGMAD